jgi:hypothetical protein
MIASVERDEVVEEYKIVPDFPNYSASNLGEVVN